MGFTLQARHFRTGQWIRLAIEGPKISSVEAVEPPAEVEDQEWIAPGFWDLQINGRSGVSFSDATLTTVQVADIIRAQAPLGTARLCPTLITAPFASFQHGLKTIAAACEADPDIAKRVLGIHVEGPYISTLDGYRGAHPIEDARDPDWDEFQRFQEAAAGRIVLMTLAPERRGAIEFIRKVVASGVVIALGHTAADGPTLRAAMDAGATLSTHLGNGIASDLARHPNPIWDQAALDGLYASFIADGHHLDPATLKVLVRAKTSAKTILVGDASPLAGLAPGTYGRWAVDPSGKILVAGTPYLAGSNQSLEVGLNVLMQATGLSLPEAILTVTEHPAHLLGLPAPSIEAGQPANLVVFRCESSFGVPFRLLRTYVDGQGA